MSRLDPILSLDDFEHAARKHLPRPVFAYVHGGVEDNAALRDNRAAFDELGFVPRVLVDVSKRSTATTLFAHEYSASRRWESRRSRHIAATSSLRKPPGR